MIDYKAFIEDCFYLKDKEGKIIPFHFNEVQSDYYDVLQSDYPTMTGIRENILKGRQFGLSTEWGGIFTTDFILSSIGEMPLTNSDIYSYKDEDTKSHFERVNLFLNSWLLKTQGGDYGEMISNGYLKEGLEAIEAMRKEFLRVDTQNYLESVNGTQIMTKTASAKVSGRGNTKQNIHSTEPAFYPNTEILSAKQLMTAAEEQVADGIGKIVRESTGNMAGDYYTEEYYDGKEGRSPFKSRFIGWFSHKAYSKQAPQGWEVPEYYAKVISDGLATIDQCYWHYQKTRELKDKEKLREYPTVEREAFLYGGEPYFDSDALIHYSNSVIEPIRRAEYATAL